MSNLTAWKLIGWDKSSKMNNTSHTLHPTSTLTSFKVISQFHSSVIIKLLNNEQRMLTPIFILTFHIYLFFSNLKNGADMTEKKEKQKVGWTDNNSYPKTKDQNPFTNKQQKQQYLRSSFSRSALFGSSRLVSASSSTLGTLPTPSSASSIDWSAGEWE